MKNLTALIMMICVTGTVFGYGFTDGIDPTKKAFEKWTKEYISYPVQQEEALNTEGMVIISFEILDNGTADNYLIDSSLSAEFDQKALEIVKNMPKEHLYANGFIEGTRFVIPVQFSVQ